jgi:hypothetical protein
MQNLRSETVFKPLANVSGSNSTRPPTALLSDRFAKKRRVQKVIRVEPTELNLKPSKKLKKETEFKFSQ